MFDVLAYLYETYWRPDACPEAGQLFKKLTAVGFESEEIQDAISWLSGLQARPHDLFVQPSRLSVRVYAPQELSLLGSDALRFLHFLEGAQVLGPVLREAILDRLLAIPKGPLSLDDFKVVVLLVFWSLGEEPDPLILDELFGDDAARLIH